jgi:hypothetical protein
LSIDLLSEWYLGFPARDFGDKSRQQITGQGVSQLLLELQGVGGRDLKMCTSRNAVELVHIVGENTRLEALDAELFQDSGIVVDAL